MQPIFPLGKEKNSIKDCIGIFFDISMPENAHGLTVPLELLIEAATGFNEPEPTETYVCICAYGLYSIYTCYV